MNKDTFLIRTEWADAILEMEPLDQATIFQNLFHYHAGRIQEIVTPNLSVKLVWKFIEPNLKRNIENYDRRCETSSENGKKGGRPAGSVIVRDSMGNEIPKGNPNSHFAYLIYDSETKLHKVGETSDLLKRRLSIKRPTEFLTICAFVVADVRSCCSWETNILKQYSGERISGDWLKLNSNQEKLIIEDLWRIKPDYPKKTQAETYLPIESLNDSDSVSDSVSDSDSDSDSDPVREDEKKITPAFAAVSPVLDFTILNPPPAEAGAQTPISGAKNGRKPREDLLGRFTDIYAEWMKTCHGVPGQFGPIQTKATKSLIAYFRKAVIDDSARKRITLTESETEERILKGWGWFLSKWLNIDPWLQDKLTLVEINSKISNLYKQAKDGTAKQQSAKNGNGSAIKQAQRVSDIIASRNGGAAGNS